MAWACQDILPPSPRHDSSKRRSLAPRRCGRGLPFLRFSSAGRISSQTGELPLPLYRITSHTNVSSQHMEEQHSEDGPSPFVAQDQPSSASQHSSEEHWSQCPICEEILAFMEMDDHMELHDAEQDGQGRDVSSDSIPDGQHKAKAPSHTTREYKSPYGGNKDGQLDIRRYGHASADENENRSRHSGTREHFRKFLELPSTITRKRAMSHPGSHERQSRKRLGVGSS